MAQKREIDWKDAFDVVDDFSHIIVDNGTQKGKKITKDLVKAILATEGAQLTSVQGGTTVEPTLLVAPGTLEYRWSKASPGEYKFGSEPNMVAATGSEWIIEWIGGVPSLKDMGELPKGADGTNGKTIEQFNATKPSGYSAGDQVFFNGDAIYEVKAGQTATTGQSPTTNPDKFDLIFSGGASPIKTKTRTSNISEYRQGKIGTNGTAGANTNSIFTTFLPTNKKGFKATIKTGYRFSIDKYDDVKKLLEHQTTNRTGTYTDSSNTADYLILNVSKTDNTAITPADYEAIGLTLETSFAETDSIFESAIEPFFSDEMTEPDLSNLVFTNVSLKMTEEGPSEKHLTSGFIETKGLSFVVTADMLPINNTISCLLYDADFKKIELISVASIYHNANTDSKIAYFRIILGSTSAPAPPKNSFKVYLGLGSVKRSVKDLLSESIKKTPRRSGLTVQLSTVVSNLSFAQGKMQVSEDPDGTFKQIVSGFIDVFYLPFEVSMNAGYQASVVCYDENKQLIRNPNAWDKTNFNYLDTRYVRFNIKKIDGTDLLVANSADVGLIVSREQAYIPTPKRYYNVLEHGVSPNSANNTLAFKLLCDKVFYSGGGTIFIPNGVYNFTKLTAYKQIAYAHSNITIEGEHRDATILNMQGSVYAPFFGNINTPNAILEGGVFKNFTVRATDMVPTGAYDVSGKAFYMQRLRGCLFEDLKLIDTLSTSLGIDILHDTHINRVHVINGGRGARATGGNGGAGIGIGSGAWEDEFFTITDCITEDCMNYGIFTEHQKRFANFPYDGKARGNIITGNVSKNNTRSGIGIVSVQKHIVSNNISFGNGEHGLDIKYRNLDVVVSNNQFIDNTIEGINIETNGGNIEARIDGLLISDNIIRKNSSNGIRLWGDAAQDKRKGISIKSNTISDNLGTGIKIDKSTELLSIRDNDTYSNSKGLYIADSHKDFICKGNAFVDGVDKTAASFTGVLTNSDL